ncbi:MAG: hypothetical protein DMG06_00385 [Acidobacteria bacterium]|nr:MAG: hypothetical protein DMG06_00385 [Acidobacteriota bacterium]
MPSLLPHRFRLEHLTRAQALEVVQRGGRELVEPDLARDIVDFVSSSQRRRLVRVMEQREVEPALLSVVCDELNRRRLDRNQTRLTADLLSGEREAIIQSFYERSFDGVDSRVRDWIEDELLTASGYRDRCALEDAIKLGLPEGSFDQLVDRRILHREEREGVVWLELTHDLLSDPAAQSRTVRVQRRQAEAAAKREAEYAHELRRTRALVAVFAVLLLVAGVALIVAFNSRGLAKAAAAKAQGSQQAALAAQVEAERSSAEATHNAKVALQAREEAENSLQKAQRNFETALGVTEELGLNPLEQTSRDLRVPTTTVLNIIRSADKSYQQLSADAGSSASVNEQHAHFLAKAADVLFQTGHIKEGFENAQKAVKLLEELKTSRVLGERLSHTKAEVYYVHGKGLLANGHISPARADFEHALNLAAAVASSISRDKHEIDRVHILSEIALGEAATKAFAFAPANAHFDQALKFIETNRLKGSEADSWRALALRGKGLSQIEDAEALRFFAEANNIVRGLTDREPENLRWQRLSAELAYRQGFSAYRLSKTEEAASFFESSRTGSENLCGREPDNLDWRLILEQTRRGLGLVYQARGEPGRAKEVLEKVLGDTNAISHAQPSWSQASFMRVVALMDLGDLHSGLHSEENLVKAWDYFTRAHQASQDFVKNAREYLEFYRVLALSIGKQGVIRDNQNRGEEALKLYQEAIQSLQPLDPVAMDSPDAQTDRAWYYSNIGDALRKLKRPREAISSYDKAVKIWAEEVRRDPNKPSSYRGLSVAYTFSGNAYLEAKDPANASAQYDFASQAISKAVTIRPTDTEFLRQKAIVNGRISDLWFGEADLKRSLTALKEAVDGVWTALHYDSSNKTLNEDLSFYRKRAEKIKSAIQGDRPSTNSGRGRLTSPQSEELLGSIQKLVAKSNNLELLVAQPSWEVQSLMAGAWRVLAPSEPESKTARQRLSALNERLTPDRIVGTRKLPLDFYDNATLYESDILQENGEHGIIAYVQRVFWMAPRRRFIR